MGGLEVGQPEAEDHLVGAEQHPLINERYGSPDDGLLSVNMLGFPLANPRVVELVIANTGRRDITAAMFHADQPIRFEFDTEVCVLLDADTEPTGNVRPRLNTGEWRTVGTQSSGSTYLEVLPSLLRRGQVVTVTVLLNGDDKPVQCAMAPLVDVEVVNESLGSTLSSVAARTSIELRFWPLPISIVLGARGR